MNILKKNVGALDLKDTSEIIEKNAYEILGDDFNNDKIDLIFLDQPFKDKNINKLLKQIKELKIAQKYTLIIIHRNKKFKENFIDEFKIIREKTYGLSKIILAKYYFKIILVSFFINSTDG